MEGINKLVDRKEYKREWQRQWSKKNPEKVREKNKQWRKNNPNYMDDYMDEYRKNNKERIAMLNKIRYDKWLNKNKGYNKDYMKEYIRKYMKHKRKTDLKCNLNHKMSGEIYKSLRRKKNGWHWEDLVGYTLEDLIKRLKKTMPKGYTWEDCLNGKLHIDHIIPKSIFHFTKPEHPDFKKCWALKNLQLLPAKENIIKSNKLSKPFQPALKISFISESTP